MQNKNSKKMSDEEVSNVFNKLGILIETEREKFDFTQFDRGFLKVDDQKTTLYFLASTGLLKEKETEGA